jgi:predicted transcriptional regulator
MQAASGLERMVIRIDLMTQLTLQIPDDLARGLESIAAMQKKSVEQVAVERLRSLVNRTGSPEAVLRAMREPPHLSSSAIDELEAAIASGRLPVRDQGAFDSQSTE